MSGLRILVVGGGMITADLILPSLYQLQRRHLLAEITVCALSSGPLRALAENEGIREAFPDSSFVAEPSLGEPVEKTYPDLYASLIDRMAPRQLVVVAVPDQMHYPVVMKALRGNQHVLCVKPLVLEHLQALEIEREAHERGLFVGMEYHKRFDRRSLVARRDYRMGRFGEFMLGEARLIEPYSYRNSNFQNWFTCDQTDPFVYVGCHYVDLVFFITGLRPIALSVSGVKRRFPNGNEGFLWSNGRVQYENGALLSVTDGLGYPDDAAGSNDQGLLMYCEGPNGSGMIEHKDNDRGVRYAYLEGIGCGGSRYNYVSPDFFRLVPWEGSGFKPVGYGYESIAANLEAMERIEHGTAQLEASTALVQRRELIEAIDRQGLLATPANSFTNELVVEAARLSIVNDGAWVNIAYQPQPSVALRQGH